MHADFVEVMQPLHDRTVHLIVGHNIDGERRSPFGIPTLAAPVNEIHIDFGNTILLACMANGDDAKPIML